MILLEHPIKPVENPLVRYDEVDRAEKDRAGARKSSQVRLPSSSERERMSVKARDNEAERERAKKG